MAGLWSAGNGCLNLWLAVSFTPFSKGSVRFFKNAKIEPKGTRPQYYWVWLYWLLEPLRTPQRHATQPSEATLLRPQYYWVYVSKCLIDLSAPMTKFCIFWIFFFTTPFVHRCRNRLRMQIRSGIYAPALKPAAYWHLLFIGMVLSFTIVIERLLWFKQRIFSWFCEVI